VNHNQNVSSAHFTKVTLPTPAKDTAYFVMIDNNREWRLATDADRSDMTDNTTPADPDPAQHIKSAGFFYLKQMNGNYEKKPAKYIAYYDRRVRYFVDRDGRVLEDASFTPDDRRKNPFATVSPEKRAGFVLTPEDERQNPLFPLHAVAGQPGYYGTEAPPLGFNFWTGVLQEFALRLNKVTSDMLGVNFDYDSWSAVTNFVRIQTTGYPLARIEKFVGRVPASPEEIALYGLRERVFTNSFVQNIDAARRLARSVKSLRGTEKSGFQVIAVFDAGIYLDMLVNVVDSFDGVDALFSIAELRHELNVSSPSMTRVKLESEEEI
jgi:hypothetical protein